MADWGDPQLTFYSIRYLLHIKIEKKKYTRSPGTHFTNSISITIHIRYKIQFAIIQILIKWLLQNFAHGMTAMLSCHVQTFVAICCPGTELQQNI